MIPFEIRFRRVGHIAAYSPNGPWIGGSNEISCRHFSCKRAYNNLTDLEGIVGGEIRRPGGIAFTPVRFGMFTLYFPRLILPVFIDEISLDMRRRGDRPVQDPAVLDHVEFYDPELFPEEPQVQVYTGNLRIGWRIPNQGFNIFYILNPLARFLGRRSIHGSTFIRGTTTLRYRNLEGIINGEIEGDMQPPLFPGAHPHVTGTFNASLEAGGGARARYRIGGFVLRGNWDF